MDERLAKLASELVRDMASGKTGRRVPARDAVAIATSLHEQMDAGTSARTEYLEHNELEVACREGCSACCENFIVVFEPEALAVAQWLQEPAQAEARQWFAASYRRWREQVGDAPKRLRDDMRAGDRGAFERVAGEMWQRRIMCAFNREGACSVYPVRPNACRACYALDTADDCVASTPQTPKTVPFAPLDDFMAKIRGLVSATHVALRGPTEPPSALCERVYELLHGKRGVAEVGRNSPCPCGSGAKYKRCCGAG